MELLASTAHVYDSGHGDPMRTYHRNQQTLNNFSSTISAKTEPFFSLYLLVFRRVATSSFIPIGLAKSGKLMNVLTIIRIVGPVIPYTFIATRDAFYLCIEDLASWPMTTTDSECPKVPQFAIAARGFLHDLSRLVFVHCYAILKL